ncbi:MAG: hypothetical protein M3O46_19850 [Myxococcota bacterium]|nr:hypothetical protein [Myxococcota bacterium]
MFLLALALAQPAPPLAPFSNVGRIFTSRALHVGVRGAAFATPFESGIALTLQISL